MNEIHLPDILGAAKKALAIKGEQKSFTSLPPGFADLFIELYGIIEKINWLKPGIPDDNLKNELEMFKKNVEANAARLLILICQMINRKIIVHITSEGDTLWKIARKYDSNIQEIFDLNDLRTVFSLEPYTCLLVPVKIL